MTQETLPVIPVQDFPLTPEEEQARYAEITWHEANGRTAEGLPVRNLQTIDYVSYDPDTGEILATGWSSHGDLDIEAAKFGTVFLREQKGTLDGHYVDLATLTVMPKTACPARVEGLRLKKLPVPCTVTITDEAGWSSEHQVSAIQAELEFDDPGTYEVVVTSVRHHDGLYTVVVP